MKTDVVLLPGLHGSTALYDAFVALAPPWARCLPVPLPTLGEQTFDGLAATLEAELRRLEGFVLVGRVLLRTNRGAPSGAPRQRVALLALCNPLVEMSLTLPAGLAASAASWLGMPAAAAEVVLADGDRALGKAALDGIRALPKGDPRGAARLGVRGEVRRIWRLSLRRPFSRFSARATGLSRPTGRALSFTDVPFAAVVELDAPHLVVQTKPAEVWDAITAEFESAA